MNITRNSRIRLILCRASSEIVLQGKTVSQNHNNLRNDNKQKLLFYGHRHNKVVVYSFTCKKQFTVSYTNNRSKLKYV